MTCRVYDCRNSRPGGDPLIILYAFPKNENLRYTWWSACADETLKLTMSNLAVCSEHFTDSDFIAHTQTDTGKRRQLKYGAVPTENLSEDAYSCFPDRPPRQIIVESDRMSENTLLSTQKQLEEISKLQSQVEILKENRDAQAAKLKVFYKAFTPKQITRLFAAANSKLTSQELEQAVTKCEKGTPFDMTPRRRRKKGQGEEMEGDDEEEEEQREGEGQQESGGGGEVSTAGLPDVVETFNEYISVEDETAVDRYVLQSKLLVTRLKTT